jgi:hypothetical protein
LLTISVGLGPWLDQAWDETSIPLSAGCDLFLRYVTRTTALEYEDIRAGKARLIERGERFGEISQKVWTLFLFRQDLCGCFKNNNLKPGHKLVLVDSLHVMS